MHPHTGTIITRQLPIGETLRIIQPAAGRHQKPGGQLPHLPLRHKPNIGGLQATAPIKPHPLGAIHQHIRNPRKGKHLLQRPHPHRIVAQLPQHRQHLDIAHDAARLRPNGVGHIAGVAGLLRGHRGQHPLHLVGNNRSIDRHLGHLLRQHASNSLTKSTGQRPQGANPGGLRHPRHLRHGP